MKNYIGVTGVTNISDNILTVNNFRTADFSMETPHVPMIGFLAIAKTLKGIPPSEGKIPHQRYTPISSLKTVMSYSHKVALNMVHFGAKSDAGFADNVISIFERDKIYEENFCRALQLNIAWPKGNELEKILNRFPKMDIVLQLPKKVLDIETEKQISDKIKWYSQFIQGTIIDPSGGKGIGLSLDSSLKLYSAIKEKIPDLNVVFAGGYNHKNIREGIKKIRTALGSRDFSIDAETGLRIYKEDKSGKVLVDMLEPNFVRGYIYNARAGLV